MENVPVSNLCDEYSFHPTQFYRWQKAFSEPGAVAFELQSKTQEQKFKCKITALEEKMSKKDEVIDEIMEFQVALKKTWSGLKCKLVESDVRDSVIDYVAVSPSSVYRVPCTVYRVLKSGGLLLRWNRKPTPTRKGDGCIYTAS